MLDLPHDYAAQPAAERLDRWFAGMPHDVPRPLTWDRGSQMAEWENLRMQVGRGGLRVTAEPCPHAPGGAKSDRHSRAKSGRHSQRDGRFSCVMLSATGRVIGLVVVALDRPH